MAISHIKSNTIGDFTGTVTVFNSVGSTATANATDLVRPTDWNSVHNFFQTISGNTQGSSTFSGTNMVLAGGNNITLSANTAAGAATLSIHGVAAQSVVPGIQSIQVSNTTYTTGNVIFSNANGLSFGSSAGGAVTASYTVPSTAGLLSNINISAGTTSTNASNFTFSNSNGLAFGLSTGAGAGVITGSYTVPSVTDYFSKTNTTFNGANISGSMTLNTNGLQLSMSVAAPGGGAQTAISGLANSQTTYTSGSVTLRDLNGISWQSTTGQQFQITHDLQYTSNTSNITSNALHTSASRVINIVAATNNTGGGTASLSSNVSFSAANGLTFYTSAGGAVVGSYTVPTQSNQTVGVYGSSQTTGSASSGTHDARSMSFIGAGIVSVGNHSTSAGGTTTGIVISATQSNQNVTAGNGGFAFQTLSFSNANNFSFGTSAGSAITGSFSQSVQPVAASASNGSFNFSTLNFSNANNVTFGTSAGGIVTASVAAPGAAAENNWFNLLGANTAGNTTASGSTIGLSGLGVTLSGTNGSVIVVSGGGGGAQFTGSYWLPELYGASTIFAPIAGSLHMQPVTLGGGLNVNYIQYHHSFSSVSTTMSISASVSAGNASSGSGSWGQTATAYWFSRVDTNKTAASFNHVKTFDSKSYSISAGYGISASWSTNVSSATCSWTTSAAIGYISQIDTAGGVTTTATTSSASSSFSSTSTNANSFSSSYIMTFVWGRLSGVRPLYIPQAGSNLSGGEYWLGLVQTNNTGSTNYAALTRLMPSLIPNQIHFTASSNSFLEVGNVNAVTQSLWRLGRGVGDTASVTTNYPLTALSTSNNNASLMFNIAGYSR